MSVFRAFIDFDAVFTIQFIARSAFTAEIIPPSVIGFTLTSKTTVATVKAFAIGPFATCLITITRPANTTFTNITSNGILTLCPFMTTMRFFTTFVDIKARRSSFLITFSSRSTNTNIFTILPNTLSINSAIDIGTVTMVTSVIGTYAFTVN